MGITLKYSFQETVNDAILDHHAHKQPVRTLAQQKVYSSCLRAVKCLFGLISGVIGQSELQ